MGGGLEGIKYFLRLNPYNYDANENHVVANRYLLRLKERVALAGQAD